MGDATSIDDSGHVSLATALRGAWPLLLSILLLMTGSGLQGSLLGVRAEQASFDATITGVVLGLYYLGYVAGSTWVPALVRSVGHIRVFASLASVASATIVLHGIWVVPVPWFVLRFTTGLCVAGLFLVSESWLNDVSTAATRGTILAVYNTVVTVGLAFGSMLLSTADTAGVVLFVLGSVLLSFAAVPVALAPIEAPPPRPRAPRSMRDVVHSAPLGVAGSAASGFTVAAALGFGAVYATRAGFGVSGASQFLVAILVGAVVGQVPLGRWSDRVDRRVVIAFAGCLILGGAAVGLLATTMSSFPLTLVAALFVGAGGFSLYGLSFAHVADYVDAELMPATGARIITVNGLGAALGPVVASATIQAFGPEGLFYALATASFALVVFTVVRIGVRSPVARFRRAHYAPVAASATIGVVDETVEELIEHDDPAG